MTDVMITGAEGQDGFYLQKLLHERHFSWFCVPRLVWHGWADIAKMVEEHQPKYIFHLAAHSTTEHSRMADNHFTIGFATACILEAVRTQCPTARVFLAGSGLQFVNHGFAIKETDAFDHSSAYAVERNYSTQLARYFRSQFGLKIYNGFLFNHESPVRKAHHVSRLVADAAKEYRAVEINDLHYEKEWMFAGDAVEAMWTLVNQDKIFEANIGTGEAFSIAAFANQCYAAMGKNYMHYVTDKKDFGGHARLVCDPSRIQSLGWRPKVSLTQLAKMMVTE